MGKQWSTSMKAAGKPKYIHGVLLALALSALTYLAWQRYQQPTPYMYAGKTLAQWIEDLGDPNYQVSDRAAEVLVQAGAASVPVLLDACEQGDVRLHRRAAAVLVRLGALAAPGLAAALKDKAKEPLVEVALVRLGPAAVSALREVLTDEKGGDAAAHVLGLIGPRAAEAVHDLIAVLKRPHAPTVLRSQAAFALGRIGGAANQRDAAPTQGSPTESIILALITALTDNKSEVREQAADALGWIGSAARPAVPALLAALKDDDAQAAIKACQALSCIGDAEAAPALLAAFQSGRAQVAVEAGRALWQLGPQVEPIVPALLSAAQGPIDQSQPVRDLLASFGPHIVPALIKALSDSEASRRETAANVLGRIGPPARAAVPALQAALKDKSSAVALVAAQALAEIDPTRAAAAVPLLADALDVPGAALALANIGPDARAAVPALIAALKSPKGGRDSKESTAELLRLHAQLALARIGAPAVPALIAALKDKREGVAPLAGTALGWILPPPKEAVPALRAALQDDRAHAPAYAFALGQLGPLARSAVPDLMPLLMDAANRPEVAVALVRIDPQQAAKVVPLLVKDLQGEDEKQRQAAVLALVRLGSAAQLAAEALVALLRERLLTEREIAAFGENWAGAVPALSALLKDPNSECRKRAIFALGQIGPAAHTALPSLIALLSDRDSVVRVGVAQVLQAIGPQACEAVPALIANLQARQPEVRSAAAAALGHIEAGAKEARRPLVECLFDPDENVRYYAALSLGRIDPHFRDALPPLRDAVHDSAPQVQLAAIDSLNHIEPAAGKEAGQVLIALSRQPYPLEVRFRAVEGLINILGPKEAKQAIPWLRIELTDAVPENRLWAARLLANIDRSLTSELVLALAAALPTPFADRRPIILQTLGEFGPKAREAVPEIERWLYDGTPGVRPAAIRALRAIHPARLKQLGLD
jgi:HEAT repeat protein